MVFQSTIPVIFGLLFTPWLLGPINLYSAALALISGALVYVALRREGPLHAWQLMIGGLFYLAFLVGAVFAIF
jgi:cation:H+ antiporter